MATAEIEPEHHDRRRVFIILILLLAIASVGVVFYRYQTTKKPLAQILPAVSGVVQNSPPTFANAFYGVARPLSVAMSPSGDRLYVGEGGGERLVRVLDKSGKEIASFGPPNAQAGDRLPGSIAVKSDGTVYVADQIQNAIFVFDANGGFLRVFEPQGLPENEWRPMGLAFDGSGNLYVTTATDARHGVAVFDGQGQLKLRFGEQGSGKGQFSFPSAIAVDGHGRMFVADTVNGRVEAFDASGQFLYEIGRGTGKGDLSLPMGVAVDKDDHLYVADNTRAGVQVYNVKDNPSFLHSFGQAGNGNGAFNFPNGLTLDANGRIYVADRGNGRVHVWRY